MGAKNLTGNYVIVEEDLCKSCRVCVEECPRQCFHMSSTINSQGYQPVVFDSDACTACGICFYVCPEPGAITVVKESPDNKTDSASAAGNTVSEEAAE